MTLRSLNSNNQFKSYNITGVEYNGIGTALSRFKDDPSPINIENIKLLLRLGARNIVTVANAKIDEFEKMPLSSLVFIILPAINTQKFFGAIDKTSSSQDSLKRSPKLSFVTSTNKIQESLDLIKLFLENGAYAEYSHVLEKDTICSLGGCYSVFKVPSEMTDKIKSIIEKINISKDIYELNDYKVGYSDEYLKFLFKTNGIPINFSNIVKLLQEQEEKRAQGKIIIKTIKPVSDEYRIFVESIKTEEEELNQILKDVFDIYLPEILLTTREKDFPSELPLQLLSSGDQYNTKQRAISQEDESIEILINKDEQERIKKTIISYEKNPHFKSENFLKEWPIDSSPNKLNILLKNSEMASIFFLKTKDLVLSKENADVIKQLRLGYYKTDPRLREEENINQKKQLTNILEIRRLKEELLKKEYQFQLLEEKLSKQREEIALLEASNEKQTLEIKEGENTEISLQPVTDSQPSSTSSKPSTQENNGQLLGKRKSPELC